MDGPGMAGTVPVGEEGHEQPSPIPGTVLMGPADGGKEVEIKEPVQLESPVLQGFEKKRRKGGRMEERWGTLLSGDRKPTPACPPYLALASRTTRKPLIIKGPARSQLNIISIVRL